MSKLACGRPSLLARAAISSSSFPPGSNHREMIFAICSGSVLNAPTPFWGYKGGKRDTGLKSPEREGTAHHSAGESGGASQAAIRRSALPFEGGGRIESSRDGGEGMKVRGRWER